MDERLVAIIELHDALVALRRNDATLGPTAGDIASDLKGIAKSLSANENGFRATRSLHAVHVPAMIAALRLYQGMDVDVSIAAAERARIVEAFLRSAQLFRQSRIQLGEADAMAALVEIETLAERAPALSPSPSAISNERRVVSGHGWLTRSVCRVRQAARLDDLSKGVGGVWEDLAIRSTGAMRLGGALGAGLTSVLHDNLMQPISSRISASVRAIQSGVAGGVGMGVAIGILFPPLLPVAAGGAVLVAMQEYQAAMAQLSAEADSLRRARREVIETARRDALRQISNGSSSMQIESEDLNLTINADTGEVDAIVLQGDYAGRNWSALRKKEQREIRKSAEGRGTSMSLFAILAMAE